MKATAIIGILLIVIGVIALGYGGISYVSRDKVIDMGPIQVTKEQTHSIPIAPIAGVIVLFAGVVFLVTSKD